jgi:2'-5' RNA ligase
MPATNADQVRNHWYWRPGWGVGSRFYTWHITFEDQPAVVQLADNYRATLAGLPTLDPVPPKWLHLTMQGIGFVDRIKAADVDAIVAAARIRCAELEPMNLIISRPYVDPESIQIAVEPAAPVRELRTTIRTAIADVWGAEHVPEPAEPFTPHMSLAYINADGPGSPLAAALAAAPAMTAQAPIDSCQLIVLNRDEGMYVWEPYATVRIGH